MIIIWKNINGNWCRKCPSCGCDIEHGSNKHSKYYASHCRRSCKSCSMMGKWLGKKHSEKTKMKMSISATLERKRRYSNKLFRMKLSESVKKAMHRPEIRKRHLDALHHSKWLKVRTDKGQLEFIDKWNSLGFKFEPNYQIHTDTDLFYVDGYDKEKNVVLEYDSEYHNKLHQKSKDLVRQKRIIEVLKPKKFWRYNKHTNTLTQVIGG